MIKLLTIVFIGLVGLCGYTLYDCAYNTIDCSSYKTILKVGGCDRYGYCGVLFDDGSYGQQSHAVEGRTVWISKRCRK